MPEDREDSFVHCLILVSNCSLIGQLGRCDAYRISEVFVFPLRSDGSVKQSDPRLLQVQKLLVCGLFLFGWNRELGCHLERFGINAGEWLTPCIGGVVEVKTIYVGVLTAKACLISRISGDRMGTRFNVRGVNDFGHVANFVETEQVIYFGEDVVSYVQTRGSVPLFWDQPGIQVGSHKIKINRSLGSSAAAYSRHIQWLKSLYGDVAIVNLLGSKGDEGILSEAYQSVHSSFATRHSIPFFSFDLHAQAKNGGRSKCLPFLWNQLEGFVSNCGYFHCKGANLLCKQNGVLRINCLDCLDRTNSAQSFIGLKVLDWMLQTIGVADKANICTRFVEVYKSCWVQNGDQCSKLYTGTAAQEGKSKFKDASISVSRTIQGNLMDKSKQQTINFLLRNSEVRPDLSARANSIVPCRQLNGGLNIVTTRRLSIPFCFAAYPAIIASILENREVYLGESNLTIFCGTWNVNGGQLTSSVVFRKESSLSNWLINLSSSSNDGSFDPYDIYAIGLQEMVDLNASNVLSASLTNQNHWREAFLKVLNGSGCYVLVELVQLVGICLFVFVRPELIPHVRDVSTGIVKTGFGGTMGNKGGTAISFTLFSTSLCFLCSHFSAGQSQVQERNDDYDGTWRRLRFPSDMYVFSHDFVFWFGDFNYRVDMAGDDVKKAIELRRWDTLWAADQLTQQRETGNIFVGFDEGPLEFPPTYKYDAFSDSYDTSEKARIPAWTDRVLFWERGVNESGKRRCKILAYNRAELKTSDHRPVGAIFEVAIQKMDVAKFRPALRDIVSGMGPLDAACCVRLSDGSDVTNLLCKIKEKVRELNVQPCCVKCFGSHALFVFGRPGDALAALSMDGVKIESHALSVELRTAQWEQVALLAMEDFLQGLNVGSFEEEEIDGATRLRMEASPIAVSELAAVPPKRPPPPSIA
ncbi:synaptojanin 1 [Trichuris trichiura]|uniref:phosphoinositide 5-phosphatase n=1 Tax=Trichuris trichiura TaxID=36087 RepID=A0A077Z058_TRITR|nr:synaptojanin 1 [Trichuris trichiura]